MDSIIQRIDKGQFWKFHGGIHPPEQKFITADQPIRTLPLPNELILPLQQHIGQAGKVIVNIGDSVLKGQPLTHSDHPMAVPIHAPTSGKVTQIKPSVIAHPSGLEELCLFLEPDGEDKWCTRNICTDFTTLSNEQLIEKIANAGISGMGGAGFPTHIKVNNSAEIEYLIINAAECEPYITADDLLIREQSPTIIDGINILHKIVSPKVVLIGIEDNKPKAIQALKNATKNIEYIKVCVIPTKYPSGGEKQLIQILTGKEIPSGSLPSSQGVVMQNIATCYAIADAVINDVPLIKRVTTVTGLGLNKPQNVWALLGTPVGFLLKNCEYHTQDTKQVIMGGPMMGFSLPSDRVPVVKITNCILAPSEKEISTKDEEIECIRCGQCADVCPAQLLPQELQWSAKAKDHDQLNKLNLFDCIECGACAYVCPSHIPLVHYYRIGKSEIREQKQLELKAEKAKVRFEARKARLERDKKAREEKQRLASEARKARMNSGTTEANNEKSAVAAALARVKAKKQQTPTNDDNATEAKSSQANPQIAAAIARAKAKKLAAKKEAEQTEVSATKNIEETTTPDVESTPEATDKPKDKKAQVAAAVAKAKAKKLAAKKEAEQTEVSATKNIEETTTPDVESTPEATDKPKDKKAQVAAAIARAKAKKLAAKKEAEQTEVSATKNIEETTTPDVESTPEATDKPKDKKAQVAAAVAKAKAKKLAAKKEAETAKARESQSENIEETTTPEVKSTTEVTDKPKDKKALVAAAVAKAKAKKLAAKKEVEQAKTQESQPENAEETITPEVKSTTEVADKPKDKKALVAAAVAKAKAKKLAAKKEAEQAKAPEPVPESVKDIASSIDDNQTSVHVVESSVQKKENQSDIKNSSHSGNTIKSLDEEVEQKENVKEDDKKSKIAAAVAKARAKKKEEKSAPITIEEDKKNRIAAAVAKAKAKKQQRSELN